jgi:hypothetical protein
MAASLFEEYEKHEKPFEHIGRVQREVRDLRIAKTDLALHYTATWTEVRVEGVATPVTTAQTVVFRVARRPVIPAMRQSNPFGLCVAQFGGLIL